MAKVLVLQCKDRTWIPRAHVSAEWIIYNSSFRRLSWDPQTSWLTRLTSNVGELWLWLRDHVSLSEVEELLRESVLGLYMHVHPAHVCPYNMQIGIRTHMKERGGYRSFFLPPPQCWDLSPGPCVF